MTRPLLLIACTLLISLSNATGQDLTIYDINITSDTSNQVPLGVFTAVEVSFANVDSVGIAPDDTVEIGANLYGYSFDTSLVLTNGMQPGDSISLNFGSGHLAFVDGTLPSFGALAVLIYDADSNTLNNGVGESFTVSDSVDNDWSCTDIQISPIELLVFDIDNGTNIPPAISSLEVELENVGQVNYVAGTRMNYSVYLGAQNFPLSFQLEGNIDAGGEVVRTITNQAVLPTIAAEVGSYQLCAASNASSDLDVNNDGYCLDIQVVDNFDPSDPLNWATSVEEVENEYDLTFVSDGEHMAFQSTLNHQVDIYDMHGARIRSYQVNGGKRLTIHDLESGIYLMDARNTEQSIQRKFVIAH